jgi:hypothetical protein
MENPQDTSKEPRSAILDSKTGFTWVQWPRFFDDLYFKYQVPSSFMDTIRFLWSACFGPDFPYGTIAKSQIPVEARALRKWIDALLAAGIFEYERESALGDQEGSEYKFNETCPQKWERFFVSAAWVVTQGGLEKEVSQKEFAELFKHLRDWKIRFHKPEPPFTLRDGTPSNYELPTTPEHTEIQAVIAKEWAAMLLRKKKKGGPKPQHRKVGQRG